MNCKLYIERNSPITIDDWVNAVGLAEGVRINDEDKVGINPKTGEKVTVTAKEGDAEVFLSKGKVWKRIYSFGHSISFHAPQSWNKEDDEIRVVTFELANLLNALVVNEVGEVVDCNPTIKPTLNSDTESLIETKSLLTMFRFMLNKIRSLYLKLLKTCSNFTHLDDISSPVINVEIVVSCNSFSSALEVWQSLAPLHSLVLSKELYNEFTGNDIPSANLEGALRRVNDNCFSLRVGEGSLFYTNSGGQGSRDGRILIDGLAVSSEEVEGFIALLLTDDRFVQARTYDKQYDFLQNSINTFAFKNLDLPFEHLPMCSNNLPFPLTQEIIDIKQNPGRSIGKIDYREIVGSTMWLGDSFWLLSGGSKEVLLSDKKLKVSSIGNVTKVVALEKQFTMSEGKEAEIQDRMRSVLYKK
jgi:hypothetical protein